MPPSPCAGKALDGRARTACSATLTGGPSPSLRDTSPRRGERQAAGDHKGRPYGGDGGHHPAQAIPLCHPERPRRIPTAPSWMYCSTRRNKPCTGGEIRRLRLRLLGMTPLPVPGCGQPGTTSPGGGGKTSDPFSHVGRPTRQLPGRGSQGWPRENRDSA